MQHKEDKPMGKEMEESKDCVNSEDLRSSTNDKEGPEDYEEVRNDSGNESEGSRNTGTVEGIPEADESEVRLTFIYCSISPKVYYTLLATS